MKAAYPAVYSDVRVEFYNQVKIAAEEIDIEGNKGNDVIVNAGNFTHVGVINLAHLATFWGTDDQNQFVGIPLSEIDPVDLERVLAIEADEDGNYSGSITINWEGKDITIDLDAMSNGTGGYWPWDILNLDALLLAQGDTGVNAIFNLEGAVFNSGTDIILKDPEFAETDGTFTNAGTLSPGSTERALLFEEVLDESQQVFFKAVYTAGIQTTRLVGNYVQTETGTFLVNVDTQTGESDRLEVVAGDVTLAGVLRVDPDQVLEYDSNKYVILTYDGEINGSFQMPLMSPYDYVLYHDEHRGDRRGELVLETRVAPTACDLASAKNHKAVACIGLADIDYRSPIDYGLRDITTDSGFRKAFGTLSGETHPTVSGTLMHNNSLRSDAVLQRLALLGSRPTSFNYGLQTAAEPGGDTIAPAFGPNDWWTQAVGSFYDQDANSDIGTAGLEETSVGFLIGVEHSGGGGSGGALAAGSGAADSEGWAIGVAFGMVQGETDIDDRLSSADTETWTFGMYGSARFDVAPDDLDLPPTDISYGLFGNLHSIDADRSVTFGSFDEQLTADYNATSFLAFVEISSRFEVTDEVVMRPYAGVSHLSLATDGFTETAQPGSTSHAALTAASSIQNLTTTTLGWRSETTVSLPQNIASGRSIKLNSMVGWRHHFGDYEPRTQVAFAGSDPFTAIGAPLDEDSLITGLTISAEVMPDVILSASHFGLLSENSEEHSFSVGLTARF